MASALILINCDFPFIEDIVNDLHKISETEYAHRVDGTYQIIAKINSKTEQELHNVLKNKISKIEKIINILTLIIYKKTIRMKT